MQEQEKVGEIIKWVSTRKGLYNRKLEHMRVVRDSLVMQILDRYRHKNPLSKVLSA